MDHPVNGSENGSENRSVNRPGNEASGVAPPTLIELCRNTAPFLFDELAGLGASPEFRYVDVLLKAGIKPKNELLALQSDLWSYFELCLSSHFATVGTFVPTDVDLAIREKLWLQVHHEAAFEGMWKLVQEFGTWSEAPVSRRFVEGSGGRTQSPILSSSKLSGHQGEWFSVAVGAYRTAMKVAHDYVPMIREQIEKVVDDHEKNLEGLKAAFVAKPEIVTARAYLDGIAAVSHNLGDLDRMIDAWKLSDTDVLKRRVFRAGHEDARSPRETFLLAGKIYQTMLANENHRHLPLREPKALRKSNRFLLDFGPFLDDWGITLVREGLDRGVFTEGDLREIIVALVNGWKRLNMKSIYTSQGYARALAGIASALPRGRTDLENFVPPVTRKELMEGGLRTLLGVSRSQFESQWVKKLRTMVG